MLVALEHAFQQFVKIFDKLPVFMSQCLVRLNMHFNLQKRGLRNFAQGLQPTLRWNWVCNILGFTKFLPRPAYIQTATNRLPLPHQPARNTSPGLYRRRNLAAVAYRRV